MVRTTTRSRGACPRALALALAAAALLPARAAAEGYLRAPPPGQAEEPEPETPSPPQLVRFVQADYPEAALARGREAEVVVRIDIDERGRVGEVELVEPAGGGFDAAALAAVRRFEFEPARLRGQPVASRILYRYRFVLEREEAEPEPADTRVVISGTVADLEGVAVAGARVEVIAAETGRPGDLGRGSHSAETDAAGRFEIGPLEPGYYEVTAVAAGFVPYQSEEPTALQEGTALRLRLQLEGARFETVVRARRPSEQLTTRSVDRREMTRVPGSQGDPLRVIQSMPGMARAPAGIGLLVVRGSAPGDTITVLETVGIPMLYHFGGLTSVVTPRLLEAIDFSPGNYGVRYGGAHGGLVEVRLRELQLEPFVGWHGDLSLDLVDVQLSLEGPIARGLSFAVGARRSHIDAVAKPIFEAFEDELPVTTAPVYWDYQAVLQWVPSSEHFLRLIGFGSDDVLELLVRTPGDSGQAVTGSIGTHTYFHGGILQYRYRPPGPVSLNVTTALTHFGTRSRIGSIFEIEIDDTTAQIRPEVVLTAGRWGRFTFGTHLWVDEVRTRITAPRPDLLGLGCDVPIVQRPEQRTNAVGPSAYLEARLRPFDRLTLTSGLLVDLYDRRNRLALEPRLWLRYQVAEGTALEGGLGLFHQSAGAIATDEFFGNPGLRLERAIHYGLGLEQSIARPLTLTVSAFYKHMDQLAAPSSRVVERFGQRVPLRYESVGLGRAYGLEVLLRHEPSGRFFGWISYTLMRSERQDGPEEPWFLFGFDQTHALTVVFGVDFGRGWEAGLRFQLATGRPFTPVAGSVYDAVCDEYEPVAAEGRSERLPVFHQLDLRVDKTWTIRGLVRLSVYLDVQNVYYQRNVETYFYSFDYRRRYPITGLPIIPSIGVAAEF